MPRFTTVSAFPESHRACASPFVHNDVCAFRAVLRMLRETYMQFSRTARVPCSSLSSRQRVKREWDRHSASHDSRLLTSSSLPTTTQICSSTRRTNGVLFTWWSRDGRIAHTVDCVLACLPTIGKTRGGPGGACLSMYFLMDWYLRHTINETLFSTTCACLYVQILPPMVALPWLAPNRSNTDIR